MEIDLNDGWIITNNSNGVAVYTKNHNGVVWTLYVNYKTGGAALYEGLNAQAKEVTVKGLVPGGGGSPASTGTATASATTQPDKKQGKLSSIFKKSKNPAQSIEVSYQTPQHQANPTADPSGSTHHDSTTPSAVAGPVANLNNAALNQPMSPKEQQALTSSLTAHAQGEHAGGDGSGNTYYQQTINPDGSTTSKTITPQEHQQTELASQAHHPSSGATSFITDAAQPNQHAPSSNPPTISHHNNLVSDVGSNIGSQPTSTHNLATLSPVTHVGPLPKIDGEFTAPPASPPVSVNPATAPATTALSYLNRVNQDNDLNIVVRPPVAPSITMPTATAETSPPPSLSVIDPSAPAASRPIATPGHVLFE